jgi:4-hydroxyphenylacetate 3-monooxygenase/4-hydroxybutyryl-CoA dehydratase/vinylacetyl-CoA-Delta-isomerase
MERLCLKTKDEYIGSLKKQKPVIFMFGEKIKDRVNHPLIKPQINVIALTYEMAQNPRYEELTTAKSHLTGEKINRFTHIHQNKDDLINKVQMTRMYARYCCCIQRCMAVDALNALSVVTYDIDKKHKTNYFGNFTNYLRRFQKEDIAATCAMTDVKGDRSLRPSEQTDPDLYLRIVEKREDGIVVRGAKAHTTAAVPSNEIIIMPTRALREKDRDYAVAFATPVDVDGLKFIARSTVPREMTKMDAPFRNRWGVTETITIFDDVFVPWDNVFMCGEWEFAGPAAELFAIYHRHSYCGCKPGVSDVLMGTAALLAEYNNVEGTPHIQSKLTDLACTAEEMYACGIAGSVRGKPMDSGTYVPDITFVNIGKYIAGTHIYEEIYRVHDIAGGLAVTCPSEKDYFHPEIKPYLSKYLKGKVDVPTEDRVRAFKLCEDLTAYGFAGWLMVASCHGGGSPEAQRITIYRGYDFEKRKNIAKCLAGIKKFEEFPEFEK